MSHLSFTQTERSKSDDMQTWGKLGPKNAVVHKPLQASGAAVCQAVGLDEDSSTPRWLWTNDGEMNQRKATSFASIVLSGLLIDNWSRG